MKKVYKQKPKQGEVIRISPSLSKLLAKHKTSKESKSATLERLLANPSSSAKTYFILPESRMVFDTIEDARGKAILLAVKSGMKKPKEKPIAVREI